MLSGAGNTFTTDTMYLSSSELYYQILSISGLLVILGPMLQPELHRNAAERRSHFYRF